MGQIEMLKKVVNLCARIADVDPRDFCEGLNNEFPDLKFMPDGVGGIIIIKL
jgi:hypothetical protein